ncbi:MAG: cytochrome c oxidase subunit II [Pseudomonadota bacterium]
MLTRLLTLAALTLAPGLVLAQEQEWVAGKPVPAGTSLQRPVTPVMEDLVWLDNMLLVIITIITLFVLGLLVYVVLRFNRKANPTPATFTHNAKLEVVWTAVPVLILVVIAIPSLRLLDKQLVIPEPELTIKATGYQWFWGYEYPDHGVVFDAYPVGFYASDEEERTQELADYGYSRDEYLLATDNRLVVPVDTNVQLLITGADVIHNWAMPSFGIKTDAIPGRVNESWFRVTEVGTYFGQCSELCGINHAYMPITVEVVSKEDYQIWLDEQIAKAEGRTDVATTD